MTELKDLPKKYPELFQNHPYSKGEDKDFFHFECDEGWCELLDTLLHIIRHNLKRYREVVDIRKSIVERGEAVPDWIDEFFDTNAVDPLDCFRIQQIKEKFGGLRFYVSFGEARGEAVTRCEGAIQLAESMSFNTCETCGNPGVCRSPLGSERIKAYRESLPVDNPYIGGGGYIQTLCEEHHKIKEEKIIQEHQKRLNA